MKKSSFYTAITIIEVLVIIYLVYIILHGNETSKYYIDGKGSVNIIGSFKNSKDAIKLMSDINERMLLFLTHIQKKYMVFATDEEKINKMSPYSQKVLESLLRNFNYEEIHENRPPKKDNGETAYSIDKEIIMLCLRDNKLPMNLVDINTLMFVLLHECAHIASWNTYQHPRQFWRIFKFLLHEASLVDVYIPVDYRKYPVKYCGFVIDENPYFIELSTYNPYNE
jgi:hypothetical protein